MDAKEIVRAGYDRVSYAYRDDEGRGPATEDVAERIPQTRYAEWLAALHPLLSPNAPVLDLGCGCGVPATRTLAESFTVAGVDFSPVQIRRARHLVPRVTFICADMAQVDFPVGSFAAIVSFFAIIHLPVANQPCFFANLKRWLCPGGYLMATVGTRAWTGTENNWLGARMYWSHTDTDTYIGWLTDLGFRILWTRFIPEGSGSHTLLLAQRAGDPS